MLVSVGCSKYHIQVLIEISNAMHQIFYWSDLSIQGQFLQKDLELEVTSSRMDLLKRMLCNVEIPKLKKIKV